jgi:XTP/dITP diphosphohydrolase
MTHLPALQRLIEVVAKLRSPDGGCPWDLEQTPESLIPYVLEEAYEVVDAIRQGEAGAIADELGRSAVAGGSTGANSQRNGIV